MLKNNLYTRKGKFQKNKARKTSRNCSWDTQAKVCKYVSWVVIHVMDMVTKILNVDIMKEDIMEDSITPQGVGDVIK